MSAPGDCHNVAFPKSLDEQERIHPDRALSGFVSVPVAQPVEDDLERISPGEQKSNRAG